VWHRENLTAVILDRDAWSDWRFERFPEFLHNRFQAAASVPLLDHGAVVGIVNICRLASGAYQPRESAFLRSLSLPLEPCCPTPRPASSSNRKSKNFRASWPTANSSTAPRDSSGQLPME
jgi:signal transduction protein with GAF and PtsI domain